MKINIQFYRTTTETLMTRSRSVNYSSDEQDFRVLGDVLKKKSIQHNFDFSREVDENHELLMNDDSKFGRRTYFEGGAEVWETIQTISLYAGSIAGFLELFQSVLPSFKAYFKERKRGKKIKIKDLKIFRNEDTNCITTITVEYKKLWL